MLINMDELYTVYKQSKSP